MTLDGDPVGGLSGMIDERPEADASELSVLRILANQAAVAMHNSAMYQASMTLRTRTEQLYAEASRHARQLAQRNEELQQTQRQLLVAHERELLDTERHRIARELHDSVTQQVLSAGMVVDVCRTDVSALGGAGEAVAERLAAARDLTRDAVAQLRSAIWALSRDEVPDEMRGLPVLLQQVARQHRAHLQVTLKIEGVRVGLSAEVEHALARIAGEALFNTARHSTATRALVRLSYRPSCVRVTIADDGDGDPAALRRRLRQELADRADGHHGLANMTTRAQELGGSFAVRRAKLGGVRIEVEVPRAALSARPGSVPELPGGTA
jgi:signal transduction histidine kinase